MKIMFDHTTKYRPNMLPPNKFNAALIQYLGDLSLQEQAAVLARRLYQGIEYCRGADDASLAQVAGPLFFEIVSIYAHH